jgi:uncharacterized protein YgbK (DUF1537 family)
MAIVLGAIADDFTGATDLAGLLARSGYPVSLRLELPDPAEPVQQAASIEIIALKCRTIPKHQAIDQVLTAFAWFKARDIEQLYWKYCSTFDSTETGNIGPVAEALMNALPTKQTIYCPAFPENNRNVFMGHLFVGENLLHESPMRDHPLTPMRDSNLQRLLSPQVKGRVGLIDRNVVAKGSRAIRSRLRELANDEVAHVIIDAINETDLEAIAEASQNLALITGGSALARPIPALFAARGLLDNRREDPVTRNVGEGQIVLSGSCSAMTRAQVEEYRKHAASYQIDAVALAESGTAAVIDWISSLPAGTPKIVYATTDPSSLQAVQSKLGAQRAGAIVEEALAEIAIAAFSHGIRRFVVAGGETSGAVAQALGVSRLVVGAEIAPGVPWTYASIHGTDVAFGLKSGNFGTPSFFSVALNMLEAA